MCLETFLMNQFTYELYVIKPNKSKELLVIHIHTAKLCPGNYYLTIKAEKRYFY